MIVGCDRMNIKLMLIIVILVLIICGGVGYYYYLMSTQEDMLKQEVINYSNKDLIKDDYQINIKTKGNYAYIEEAIKKYYRELSNNIKTINNYVIDSELEKIITIDNYESDGPKFVESKKTLDTAKKDIVGSMDKIKELCSDKYIKNLISDKIHDDYYIKIYNNLMYTKKDLQEFDDIRTDVEQLSNTLVLYIDKSSEVLKILEDNEKIWNINKGSLYFNDAKVLNEYNVKYKEVLEIANAKLSKYKNRSISKGNSNSVVNF